MIKEYFEVADIKNVKYLGAMETEPEIKMIVNGRELICSGFLSAPDEGKKYNIKLTLDANVKFKSTTKIKKIQECVKNGFSNYYNINGAIIDIYGDPYGYYAIIDCGIMIEISLSKNHDYSIGDFICAEGELLLDEYVQLYQ